MNDIWKMKEERKEKEGILGSSINSKKKCNIIRKTIKIFLVPKRQTTRGNL